MKEIQEVGDEVSKQEVAFYNLQKKLDVDQYELKLNDSWKLGDLFLSSRSQLTFIYDLIEEWEFEIVWENVAL
jgi:hypothetical protein